MSFQSKFSDGIYKGTYPEEKVSTWADIGEIQREQHPYPADPFSLEVPRPDGKLKPTHFTVKVPPNTLVVYYPNPDDHSIFSPFRPGETVLYLGEIVHMRGHGAFVDREGRVRYGYHLWNFRVIPEEEV